VFGFFVEKGSKTPLPPLGGRYLLVFGRFFSVPMCCGECPLALFEGNDLSVAIVEELGIFDGA